ncbi:hypothetical protein [Georgenia sp. SYP-B2076]|uniref:hypothetical protein n=1 Tax=Georgenia sp. SYP-B2076 TaxID=2495881 RepID=UPI000F8C620E|nr:hypothetical protein [Georgenia sp. SYP-B2076]
MSAPPYPQPGSAALGAPPALRRQGPPAPAEHPPAARHAEDPVTVEPAPRPPAAPADRTSAGALVAALLGAAAGLALQRRWGR